MLFRSAAASLVRTAPRSAARPATSVADSAESARPGWSRAPAWLPAADWSETLPSCFRSEAFAEDLFDPSPGAGSPGSDGDGTLSAA